MDVVQLLLQHGADVHAADDGPLQWASANGHTAVVQLLIQHGAVLPAELDDDAPEADETDEADDWW